LRKIAALIAICLTLFLSGCVPVDCLNPLYSDKNTIVDKTLVGEWVGDAPDEGGLRIDLIDGVYQVVMTEKKESGFKETIYEGHLVSLGGEKYLDLSPKMLDGSAQHIFTMDSSKKGAQFSPALERMSDGMYLEILGPIPAKGNTVELRARLKPVHWIVKVEVTEKTLALSYFDREWVQEAIDKNLIQARHSKAGSNNDTSWVLSGSTAELQQFVMHHGEEAGAFSGLNVLRRLGEQPAEKPAKEQEGDKL
jgi:hypothetical protein